MIKLRDGKIYSYVSYWNTNSMSKQPYQEPPTTTNTVDPAMPHATSG